MNYRCYQTTLQRNIFTQIGAVRNVDWIFILGVPVWGMTGRICDIGQKVLQIIFQQETAAATVTATFSSL
jgi:hypothetical protein